MLDRKQEIFSNVNKEDTDKLNGSYHRNTGDDEAIIYSSLFIKVFSHLPEISKPLMPFVLLKYLVSNHLQIFIQSALKKCAENTYGIDSIDFDTEHLTTSCVNTAYIVGSIFMNDKTVSQKMKLLRRESTVPCSIKLPSRKWEYKIDNLFSGNIVYGINNDPDFANLTDEKEKIKKLNSYITENINGFFQYNNKKLDEIFNDAKLKSEDVIIDELNEYFEKLDYQFNYIVLNQLYIEILNNEKKITTNNSIIYCVGIVNKKINDTIYYDHIFIIEQFLLEKNLENRYRIYQSWISQATLLQDIENKQFYDELGEISLDQDQIKIFLNDLEKLYCKQRNLQNYQKCFGYHDRSSIHPSLLTFKDNTLSGLNVRYFTAEVDPEKCFENLTNLIKSNLEFKQAINQFKC